MSIRNILILLVAIGAAGLTAFYANNWINAERAAMRASTPVRQKVQRTARILIAAKELQAGDFVRAEHLKWQPWPEQAINQEYALEADRELEDFVGAVVRNLITPGQPVTDRMVVHAGDRGFLAAVLGPGGRAVSVSVNATSGISGFIFPGDRIDVLLTSRFNAKNSSGEDQSRYVTRTLLTGLRVLAIDQKTENRDGEVSLAKTVTLEVNPKQAEKIAIGMAMGTLSLSLQSLARVEGSEGDGTDDKGQTSKDPGYTLDTEVNSLLAGTPPALSTEMQTISKVTVLRGDKAN